MAAIDILSINVHGLRDLLKCSNVVDWLKTRKESIFFLQETYFSEPADTTFLKTIWKGSLFSSFGGKHSRGVTTLIKESLPTKKPKVTQDNCGRWVNVILDTEDSKLQLLNVYAPCPVGERAAFFQTLPPHIRGGVATIIGGDFNCITNLFLDKLGGDSQAGSTALEALTDLLKDFNLSDIFRSMHPSARKFTWTNSKVSSRLDKFYVSPDILANTKHSEITVFPFSDHDAPFLSFKLPNSQPRGRGTWKFNTSLLANEEFTCNMKHFLKFWVSRKKDFAGKLHIWWDIGKMKIRNRCKKFSKRLAKEKREKRTTLEEKLQQATISLDKKEKETVPLIRREIEELDLNNINCARIRAKALEYQSNEKSSRYFFSLENSRQSKKVIRKLKTPDGRVIQDSRDLLGCIANFYESPYSPEPIDNKKQNALLNTIDRFVPENFKLLLDESLSADECHKALTNMKSDKSPGSDGLPAEFYNFFWDEIGQALVEVLNFCFTKGLLTESMRLAIISLLYKKGDIELLKNWRPISLLNVDYKIGSKAFANRLQLILPSILNSDQTCSVPGRSIFENLMLARDSIDYCQEKKLPLALIKIDQEKAFDRVNWDFLLKVLERMNFGPKFMCFVKTMYTNVSCQISNNGHLSRKITLKRGVRQGCPLSPLLYCIVAETLVNLIRQNLKIDGLRLPGSRKEVKISQYADDTTLFLRNNFSVEEAIATIKLYELGSGSKVNYDIGKSCGKWFNKPPYISASPSSPLKWTENALEILGLEFGTQTALESCWIKRVEKLTNRLEAWRHRSLSLKGKTLIVNTIALSGLVFVGTIYHLPPAIEKQVNRAIFQFIWTGKNELVSRKTMFQPPDKGGQGVVDIHLKTNALHLKFLQSIIDTNYDSPWVSFARYNIGFQLFKYFPTAKFLRSNLFPHALTPSPHYTRLLSLCNLYKVFVVSLSAAGTRVNTIYGSILALVYSGILPALAWNAALAKPRQWQIPWEHIRSRLSQGPEDDVLWKIYHRVLKTASYLKSWGLNIPENCDQCQQIEDINHVFIDCPIAVAVFTPLQPIFEQLLGTFSVLPSLVIFFEFPNGINRNAESLCRCLLKVTLHSIWMHRCDRRFEKKAPNPLGVVSSIKATIRNRIKFTMSSPSLFAKEFPIWAYNDILCSYQNGTLSLKI